VSVRCVESRVEPRVVLFAFLFNMTKYIFRLCAAYLLLNENSDHPPNPHAATGHSRPAAAAPKRKI
jgi:hypothetical protein